ncbi:MAG: glycosyltransferase [Solirubrobacteraceae bacterium]
MSEPADQGRGRGAVDCSILVPVLNEDRYIVKTVAAMRRQCFDGRIEFLLVDGDSTDRTPELLADLARDEHRIRILRNPRRSTPSGLNVGLAHARGRWVARMDAHTEYPDDYLRLGVQRLQQGGTRWVSGPQVPRGENAVSRAVTLALGGFLGRGSSRRWGHGARGGEGEEYELDSGVFAGVWERETLLAYHGWDERWLRNQDSEMAGRFLACGERLVCIPAMAALYTPRGTLIGLWKQYVQYGEYRTRTAVRHPHTLRRSHLLPPAVVLCSALAACGPRNMRSAARAAVALYGSVLVGAGIRARSAARPSLDASLVPVVLAVMHFGHGTGMLRGAMRYGFPIAAIADLLGGRDADARPLPSPDPVYAPSLDGSAGGHE